MQHEVLSSYLSGLVVLAGLFYVPLFAFPLEFRSLEAPMPVWDRPTVPGVVGKRCHGNVKVLHAVSVFDELVVQEMIAIGDVFLMKRRVRMSRFLEHNAELYFVLLDEREEKIHHLHVLSEIVGRNFCPLDFPHHVEFTFLCLEGRVHLLKILIRDQRSAKEVREEFALGVKRKLHTFAVNLACCTVRLNLGLFRQPFLHFAFICK